MKNSYRSEASINQLDWTRAWFNHKLVDYYRGLIALRRKLPCLQDKTAQASNRILSAVDLAPGCVGISLDNRDGTKWDKILLIVHTGKTPEEIRLPHGTWQVLVDDVSSFRWKEKKILSDPSVHALPVSALILGRIPHQ